VAQERLRGSRHICWTDASQGRRREGLSGNNATDYYRFGYVDVRRTGNSYGTAVNPYASLPSSNPTAGPGGDGFDLAWAVDANGCPVGVGTVHFVRVYTSVLYNTGVFGETSTEVCGIYTAAGTGSGAATTDLEVYIDNPNYDESYRKHDYPNCVPISGLAEL
jgi:hypothetical protein